MLLTKEVEIRLNGFNVEHYKSLGYEIPMKKATKSTHKRYGKDFVYDFDKTIMVKIEDLQKGSNVRLEVLCDWCKKNKAMIQYDTYNKAIDASGNYACKECAGEKRSQVIYEKYGVNNIAQVDEVKEKMKTTARKRYGCDNPAQTTEVKTKIVQTLYAHSSQKTSRQQFYIFNLYKTMNNTTFLNYPISCYNADICLLNEKIDIEYDGGFHNGNVKTRKMTQEEFDQKEIIRNNIIKKEGYKQMRIISSNDKLPSDDTLLQMLSDARTYFSQYSDHSWIEFNISTSTVRNAENPHGIPYDYGSLRTIKESDLNAIKNSDLTAEQSV